MSIDKFIKEVEEYNVKVNEFKEKAKTFIENSFSEITKEFFKENPEVQCIFWRQYTPYFNDGEPCEFGIRELEFVTSGFDIDNLVTNYEYEEEYTTVLSKPSDWVFEKAKEYELTKKEGDEYYLRIIQEYNKQREGLADSCEKFQKFIHDNESSFESLFGDHVCVYLTPDNDPIVEEYEHD